MGLIKAAVGALSGTLGDTWKEAIHCPVIGNDTVVVNGEKMHNGNARSSNTKGTDNVISNDFEQSVFRREALVKQLNYLPEKEKPAPAPVAKPAAPAPVQKADEATKPAATAPSAEAPENKSENKENK